MPKKEEIFNRDNWDEHDYRQSEEALRLLNEEIEFRKLSDKGCEMCSCGIGWVGVYSVKNTAGAGAVLSDGTVSQCTPAKQVQCSECCAVGPMHPTRGGAIRAWNKMQKALRLPGELTK